MMLLVIGGSGSGKSEYAEKRAEALSREGNTALIYAAAMRPLDVESQNRILRHRQMRKDRNFITVEQYTHLERLKPEAGSTVLLECLSNLMANEMYDEDGRGEDAAEAVLEGILQLRNRVENLVLVGNNVFSDGIGYEESTLTYLRNLALVQNQAARYCDEVVEVVCGIPLPVEGGRS